MIDEASIEKFAELLAASNHLAVLTGAGISKESGVPTFRDAMDGLWAKYDPTQLATPTAFRRNPKLVWDWYTYRRELVAKAAPNAGHHALATLEDLLPEVVIITQNVDGFHQAVGSTDVICLHGDIRRNKCFANCQGDPTLVELSEVKHWAAENGPPICPRCQNAYLRPDVVWFEESLPTEALYRANQVARSADVMLVIGTSGIVYPAAMLPAVSKHQGAVLLEINPVASAVTTLANHHIAAPAGEALPLIVTRIRQLLSSK